MNKTNTKKLAITSILCAYPVAVLLMEQSTARIAFYAYIVPFFISTAGGAIISTVLIYSLKKSGVLTNMQKSIAR